MKANTPLYDALVNKIVVLPHWDIKWDQLTKAFKEVEEAGIPIDWQAAALHYAFLWHGAPQGFDYWDSWNKLLLKGAEPPEEPKSPFYGLEKGKIHIVV